MTSVDKIDRPPSAENWARLQCHDVNRTARNMFSFLRGGPTWNYLTARSAAKYYVEDGIDRKTALKIAGERGNAHGRKYNIELVNAFFDLVECEPIEGVRAFDQLIEWFPLRRGAAIPIKPLTVIRQNGNFTPLFLCPWSRIAFDQYQASLFMTVLERSIFTLTDFQDAEGKIYFFPQTKLSEGRSERRPVIWKRGDIPLLSEKELDEQVRIFFESKEIARVWYQDYLDTKKGG